MIGILMKVRLSGLLSSFTTNRRTKQKYSRAGSAGMLLLLGVCFLFLLFAFGAMSAGIAEVAFGLLEAPWFYFGLLGLFSFLLMLLTGIFAAKNQLYEPRDNELLLSMPIPPRAVLISRMLTLYLTDLLFEAMIMLPAGIVALMYAAPTVASVLFFLLCFLLLPLLSLALSSFFGWLLALLEAKSKHKTLPRAVVTCLFLVLYFLFVFRSDALMEAVLANAGGISDGIRRWVLPLYWLGAACAEGRVVPMLLFALVCLAPAALAVWLLARSFLALATTRVTGKAAVYSAAAAQRRRVASPVRALLRKELGYFFSCFAYLLNCGLGAIFLVMAGVVLLVKRPDVAGLIAALGEAGLPGSADFAALVLAAAGCFLAGVGSCISAPSVSLEGSRIWIPLSMPVAGKDVLLSKSLAHIVVMCGPALFFSVCAGIATRPSVWMWPTVILLPQFFVCLSAFVGTLINVRLPKLDWMDETVPVKQSSSVLLTMLVCFVSSLVTLGETIGLSLLLPPALVGLLTLVLLGGVTGLLLWRERTVAGLRFEALG